MTYSPKLLIRNDQKVLAKHIIINEINYKQLKSKIIFKSKKQAN